MTRVRMRLGLTVMLCAASLLPSTARGGAGLRVDSQVRELGEVKAGTAAVATFVFHNDGDRDVTILRATPS